LIVVTGGAGFIGSNIVRALNDQGRSDVLVVDELERGRKLLNLVDCEIADLLDKDRFLERLLSGDDLGAPVEAIIHEGACSDTTEWDGGYVMATNYDYPKALLGWALEREVPFLYASSASVYGGGRVFKEERQHERPLNLYAFSKFQFDQYVRRLLPGARSQLVGLRYFNVYGPREAHKGEQASLAYKLHLQLLETGRLRLFEASDGYEPGEQLRDFVWVGDAVAVTLWMLEHRTVSGIFNVGSGRSQTFNAVARAVIAYHSRGEIDYVPFPAELEGVYQSYTCADITSLRKAGYDAPFLTVEEAIPRYLDWLQRA
jgi:ADP-L-glycero-D-manno-heptose 6-epimerase